MNIYVPEHFLTESGELTGQIDENGLTQGTVPVIFENGLAGYHEADRSSWTISEVRERIF